jgi:hypothetical protein
MSFHANDFFNFIDPLTSLYISLIALVTNI